LQIADYMISDCRSSEADGIMCLHFTDLQSCNLQSAIGCLHFTDLQSCNLQSRLLLSETPRFEEPRAGELHVPAGGAQCLLRVALGNPIAQA